MKKTFHVEKSYDNSRIDRWVRNNFKKIPIDAQLIPTNAYGASKAAASLAAKALCIERKIELAILRVFHVYGPGDHPNRFWASLVKSAKDGKDFEMTEGAQIRDFQHVRDTVRQIEKFLSDESPTTIVSPNLFAS